MPGMEAGGDGTKTNTFTGRMSRRCPILDIRVHPRVFLGSSTDVQLTSCLRADRRQDLPRLSAGGTWRQHFYVV